jgi:hypothetical protein
MKKKSKIIEPNDTSKQRAKRMKTDYIITPYYTSREPNIEKFRVSSGGVNLSTHKTYEEAARIVVKLVIDPWHFDRGFTRFDRVRSASRTF